MSGSDVFGVARRLRLLANVVALSPNHLQPPLVGHWHESSIRNASRQNDRQAMAGGRLVVETS